MGSLGERLLATSFLGSIPDPGGYINLIYSGSLIEIKISFPSECWELENIHSQKKPIQRTKTEKISSDNTNLVKAITLID